MPETFKKPHVSINMAMSADGKISTRRRETFSLGSNEDRFLMDVLRARCDAVVIGAQTLSLDGWAVRVRDTSVRQKRIAKGKPPHPLNVVVSSGLDLPVRAQFFTFADTDKLVVTTKKAPPAKIKKFERVSEVVVVPRMRVKPSDVLAILARRGIKKVLVEGGGTLNYSFFRDNLVDELYVTVTPRILGGSDAPTPVDGKGFLADSHVHLELVSSRRRGSEVFLRYRVITR
jgi:2,5-diamino-6-(ribosylamino)-4(3H)-pyrimidinone 5'-phosphate reductase